MVNQYSCIVDGGGGGTTNCHKPSSKIGSFRDGGTESEVYIEQLLLDCDGNPELGKQIFDGLFMDDADEFNLKSGIGSLITHQTSSDVPLALLNHGAFGKAYDDCMKLSIELRGFAEQNPDLFYDQLLMPLLKHSYNVCSDFFGLKMPSNCVLVPNCTMGMKAVMDKLLLRKTSTTCHGQKMQQLIGQDVVNVGYVSPIYGATKNLLKSYVADHASKIKVTEIVPENFLFQEDPELILKAIDQANANSESKLSVILCDEIASQTGRILPLLEIAEYCEKRNIILVVDGTQSFEFTSSKIEKVDYWVMSTHKWISNVKTCGVVLWGENVDCPDPPAVSFGYFNENVQDRFLWTGMMDTYISYIVLAKALSMRRKYGERQIRHASELLRQGLLDVLHVQPLLESNGLRHQTRRLMNIFELNNVDQRWRTLVTGGSKPGNREVTANDIQTALERIFGVHVSVKDFRGGDRSCGLSGKNVDQRKTKKGLSFYVRVCAFSYNTMKDFERFRNIMYNNISLTDHIHRNKLGSVQWDPMIEKRLITPQLSKLQQVVKMQFLMSFERYETLFDALETKALFIRAEKLRHHLIFYFGHTAVFYVNKMISAGFLPSSERVDPHFESVFAIGVDEMTWDDILTETYDWCGFLDDEARLKEYYDRVKDYRQKVKHLVVKLIEGNDIRPSNLQKTINLSNLQNTNHALVQTKIEYAEKIPEDSIYWILLMGIEHENIHLETSCSIISDVPLKYIKEQHDWNYELYPYEKKEEIIMNTALVNTLEKLLEDDVEGQVKVAGFPPTSNFHGDNIAPPPSLPHRLISNRLLPVTGGAIKLGKDNVERDFYGWDNEFGTETHELKDFEVSEALVSNAEYLMFMKKGRGYQDPQWWSEEGWRYVTDMKVTIPRSWRKECVGREQHNLSVDGEVYYYRTLLKEIPLQWSWPVEVNNLEAQAFCKWKSFVTKKSIRLMSHEEQFLMRQKARCTTANTNLNYYSSPSPVYHHHGYLDEGVKLFDVYGNVWRHSVSVLTFLDGFKTHPVYEDFTLPTIDGKHNHILGGSWVSLGNSANLNARLGFRRHFHQYAGIRYVSSQNNNYHKSVPLIFDNIMSGKEITEHYTVFKNDTLPLMLTDAPTVENWPAKFGQLAANKINEISSETFAEDGSKSRVDTVPGTPLKVLVAHGSAGRVTLELLRGCKNLTIDHTDSTANALQILDSLLKTNKLQWNQKIEGDINELLEYRLKESEEAPGSLQEKKQNVVSFKQIFDYSNIKSNFDGYDVIVADIRFRSATKQIAHMSKRLNKGGMLILGTIDNLVLDEHQERGRALEGFLLVEDEMRVPHMYRETINKHQYAISHYSCWKKIGDSASVNPQTTIVEGAATNHNIKTDTYYEDNSILKSYEKFHFGIGEIGVKNFPLAIAEFCIEMAEKYDCKHEAAMEAGCGPGRTAFELCKKFDKVEAFDYSQNFIDSLHSHKTQFLGTPEMEQKITAYQGDAHEMKASARNPEFDLILGCNLIDRLHTPEKWINQAKEMCKGLVIICSPYTWLDIHTPTENWVGGKFVNAEKYFTMDGLKDLMYPEFNLVHHRKIVFSIPDSDGTFQYTASNCTVFEKVQ